MELVLIPLLVLLALSLVGPVWAMREWLHDLRDDRARRRPGYIHRR